MPRSTDCWIFRFLNASSNSLVIGRLQTFYCLNCPAFGTGNRDNALFPRLRSIVITLATMVMAAFTVYIIYLLNFAPTIPWSCEGIMATIGWREHLIFNSLLVLVGCGKTGFPLSCRDRRRWWWARRFWGACWSVLHTVPVGTGCAGRAPVPRIRCSIFRWRSAR